MNFKWDSSRYELISKTLDSLIQTRQGSWLSDSQRHEMRNKTCSINPNVYNEIFGVRVEEGQFVFDTHARMIDSTVFRPLAFIYICDGAGVCVKYKIKYRGSEGKGFLPNPEFNQIMWKRDVNCVSN